MQLAKRTRFAGPVAWAAFELVGEGNKRDIAQQFDLVSLTKMQPAATEAATSATLDAPASLACEVADGPG